MANDKIDNEIFVTILRIRKNNNRADLDSIYKEITKFIDFDDVTKEFLDDRIHTSINDGKIINKLNRNANSYYVNSNLVDLERPNLLTSSQSVQRIALAPTDSLSNSNDILASKTPQLEGVTLTPTISIPNSSEDAPTLNVNETPIISKSANLSCIPNSTKSKNLNRHENEQTNTETENLRAELIALKSFVVDQIYMVKKRSKDKDDELLIKNLLDQIGFLKQELKSKDTIIKMILENCRQNTDYKPQTVKETAKHSDKAER